MAQERLSMLKISEVLKFKYELHLAERAIAAACDSSRSTLQDIHKRCLGAQVAWPLPGELDKGNQCHLHCSYAG